MRILLADDHGLYREGIQLLLRQLEDVHVFEACNREEIQQKIEQEQPDILLLDLDMPGVETVMSVYDICTQYPKVAVVIMSGNDSPQTIENCFEAGVAGFIPKSASTDTMLSAIRIVYAGDKYIPPQAYQKTHTEEHLTHRQKEIYRLIAAGQSNKQVANTLGISESTVKQHASELFRKLGVSNRVEAILKYQNTLTP